MELLTDVLAIAGWIVFGFQLPILVEIRSGQCTSTIFTLISLCISFGLIAASLVLG